MENKEIPQILTGKEVAKKLGICMQTLNRLRKEGKIKYIQIGRKMMYTSASVAEFIVANTTLNQGE